MRALVALVALAGSAGVVTPPPVKLFAEQHGLTVLQPEKIKAAEARAQFEPLLKEADLGVVAAYGRILPSWMLEAPGYGCINVHSSLLPKYRGAAPINWAIARGERETGVTIMQMDVGLDTGAILLQRAAPIGDQETAPQLTARLAELGAKFDLVPEAEVWGFSKTMSRLGEAVLVAMESGHPKACVLPDIFHLYKGGSGYDSLRLISGQAIYRRELFTAPSS